MTIIAAILALLAVSARAQVPSISCSFTANITLTSIYNYKIKTYHYMHYSSDNKVMRKIGEVPDGYPGNSSMMFKPPNNYYFLEPFFGRTVCSIVPLDVSFECFQLDSDARCESYNVTCPNDHSRRCDVWVYTDYKDDYIHYWLYSDTAEVHKVRISGDYHDETYVFNSFIPYEPPASIFEMPETQPCIDLTVDPNPEITAMIESMKAKREPAEKKSANKKKGAHATPSLLYYNPAYGETDVMINDPERIKEISLKATTWKAGPSPIFEGKSLADFAKMLRWPGDSFATKSLLSRKGIGRTVVQNPDLRERVNIEIPEEFDSRKQWANCSIDVIRDQSSCGSCWAFGAVEALEDRFCIHGGNPVVLSPMYLVSCYKDLDGCDGGFTDIAWEDLVINGTTTEECFPYMSSTKCPTTCTDGSDIVLYKPKNAYSIYVPFVYESNVKAIQLEIMTNGPVETT